MKGRFTHILFDLDNTLYSEDLGLEKNVSRRVNEYVAAYLNISYEEALAYRRERIIEGRFGTTLEWLISERGFDTAAVERYFSAIHPPDEACSLKADPALRSFLLSLPLPLAILTNSPMEHADRILDKLGVKDLFPSIFDIRGGGLKGKPQKEAFNRAMEGLKTSPERCLFVDDTALYIEGYRAMGGYGVLLDENDTHRDFTPPRITRLEQIRELL
jgi:putative hydrolase of the HAD superfamily